MPQMAESDKDWNQLSSGIRMQIIELAVRGRPYPDPQIAAMAQRWAEAQLTLPFWRRRISSFPLLIAGYVLSSAFSSYLAFALGGALIGSVLTTAIVGFTFASYATITLHQVVAANSGTKYRPRLSLFWFVVINVCAWSAAIAMAYADKSLGVANDETLRQTTFGGCVVGMIAGIIIWRVLT